MWEKHMYTHDSRIEYTDNNNNIYLKIMEGLGSKMCLIVMKDVTMQNNSPKNRLN